jgi:osmoprotectant transport system permease protein
VATAALALVLDGALGLLEQAATQRARGSLVAGLVLLFAIVGAALALRPSGASGEPAKAVRIGAKTFTEQYVLAQALSASLRARGFETVTLEGLGSNILFDALAQSDLDVAVDYSGTLWANQLHRSDAASRQTVLDEVGRWLDATHGILSLGSLGFENAYALALPRTRAQALGVDSLAQLSGPIQTMRLGSDYEFFGRPEWKRVAAAYDLKPREQVSSDPSLMYSAVQAGDVDLITTYSTDGRIDALGLKVLADPQHAFPPYDAMLLLSPKARRDEKLVQALRSWVGAVPVEAMRHANQLVDVDGKSKLEAAQWLVSTLDGGAE